MPWIAGVDGYKGGWIAALRDTQTAEVTCEAFRSFTDLLDGRYGPTTVAVDIPIGLMDSGPRLADREARRLLRGRACCVFPAPIRPVLQAATYAEANALSKALNGGKGLPAQAFALVPKISEVDREARTRPPGLIREVHPEVSFWRMNGGQPIPHSKHNAAGLSHRRRLLAAVYGTALSRLEERASALPGVKVDDLYDALAALETARRILAGLAEQAPTDPPTDSCGLPMEIVF